MSAIYGVIHWEAPVSAEEMTIMGRRLQHRATEPAKLWYRPTAMLGFLGLPTTHSSKFGAGLHHFQECGVTVTADARLEERDSLAGQLECSVQCNDAALIGQAYIKWGDSCVGHIRGDFAFALWDEKQSRLLLARDTFGVKPLYYRTDASGVRFASELKALLRPESDLNVLRLAEFHESLPPAGSHTFWRDIECLEAGTMTVLTSSSFATRRFDSLLHTPDSAHEAPSGGFQDLFLQAVKSRMERVGTLACMLSGGLDSSAISAIAASVEQPARTISNVFPAYCSECDERSYIDSLLAHGNFQPQFVSISETGSFERLVALIHQQAEPFSGFGMFSCGSLYQAARERGINIMLDGHGGDEVATGTDWWIGSLLRSRKWLSLFSAVRERAQVFQEPYLAAYLKAMVRTHVLHTWPLSKVSNLARRLAPASKGRDIKSAEEGIFRMEHLQTAPEYGCSKSKNPNKGASSDAEAHRNMLQTSIQFRYLDELDRASAAHQVEARYPFFDRKVVAYCLSAQPEEKFHKGWPRAIVRNSLGGLLPQAIKQRVSKTSFLNPLVNSIRGIGQDVWDTLSSQPEVETMIDRGRLLSAVRDLHTRPQQEPNLVLSLWTALVTFVWLHERRRLCAG